MKNYFFTLLVLGCGLCLNSTTYAHTGVGEVDCLEKEGEVAPTKTSFAALSANLPCNTNTELINTPGNTHVSAVIIDDVPSIIPLCLGSIADLGNLVDSDTDNFVSVSMTGLACNAIIAVEDTTQYPAGSYAGFEVSTDNLLTVNIGATVDISTYLNGLQQESQQIITPLIGVNTFLLNDDGNAELGFVTTLPFDEIRIEYNSLVSVLFENQVYNAIVKEFCPGPSVVCNSVFTISNPEFPTIINSQRSGLEGVVCAGCAVNDANSLLTPTLTDYASIQLTAGVGTSGRVSVKNVLEDYPAESHAGFVIYDSVGLIQADLFESINVCLYHEDTLVECATNTDLIDLLLVDPILGNQNGLYNVGFKSTKAFDEVVFELNSLVGSLNHVSIFAGFVTVPTCPDPTPIQVCNETLPLINTPSNDHVTVSITDTVATTIPPCLGSITDVDNVIEDVDSFATVVMTGLACSAEIAVKDTTSYPGGTYAGFRISANDLIASVGILATVDISTYRFGLLQETSQVVTPLVGVNSSLIDVAGAVEVGFLTELPFDEVRITYNSLVSALFEAQVYSAVVKGFCLGPQINCDTVISLTNPAFPTYINGDRTGLGGIACVGCSVEGSQALLTVDTSDFAQLSLTAGVGSTASISVKNALEDFAGLTYAGFQIYDTVGLLQADLLQSINVCQYHEDTLVGCQSGADLIDLYLVGLPVIGDSLQVYNIAVRTEERFDEIVFELNSLVASVNVVQVYNAFITKGFYNGTNAYVDLNATGNQTGLNWKDAYLNIDDICPENLALIDTIFVAEGTYIPRGNDRNDGYIFNSDIVLIGGYSNMGMDRDSTGANTILCGDIGVPGNSTDNTYHIVEFTSNVNNYHMTGFTISCGYADGTDSYDDQGAGLLSLGSGSMNHIIFTDNYSEDQGASALIAGNGTSVHMQNITAEPDNISGTNVIFANDIGSTLVIDPMSLVKKN